ncbi:MAG: hypothetical protein EYC62_08180 [Alphaproteobacteria bacterium]|nr:MAG: hypothetical protein EYC62_08180 [Alphaproteobacteria bacterium]
MSGDSVQWVKVDRVTFNSIHGRTKKNKGGTAEESASYAFGKVCGRNPDGYASNVGIGHIDNTGRIFQVTQCLRQVDLMAFKQGFDSVRGTR